MSQIKVELQEYMGSDKSIAEAAWTSSLEYQAKEIKTKEDAENLVKRLANDKHATPFESVVLRFWIRMPIATDRQHMTHRIGSHNGISARYRTMPNEWLAFPDDVDELNSKVVTENFDPGYEYNQLCAAANNWYQKTLSLLKQDQKSGLITNTEYKRAREFYRGVLPQNNMTERVTIFNLRSFANYMKLRDKPEAQPEIRLVAQLMLEEVKKAEVCPIALDFLEKNGWNI